MKTLFFTIMMAFVLSNASYAQEAPLREELGILEPLSNILWVSEDVHPDGKTVLHHSRRWVTGHQGKILYITQKCEELGTLTEGYFFFNPDSRRVELFMLTSNGNITIGAVTTDGNILRVSGTLVMKDRKLEFMNTYEITPEGDLEDKYYRMENGEWKAGHSRVWRQSDCIETPAPAVL